VKHQDDSTTELLTQLLDEAGLVTQQADRELMIAHLDWVLEANKSLNLTAITEPSDAVRLHIVDSLLALGAVNGAPKGQLLDLGTGAGFPGIPLAIATGRITLLVDSVQKKCRALEGFLSTSPRLRDSVAVQSMRAEDLTRAQPGSFQVVTARAVSRLGALVELAAPLLADGGRLVALKARIEPEELDAARRTGSTVGLEVTEILEQALPGGEERRTIVTITKVGKSTIALPRRMGLAQRQPLF
jgi:16S rRNA (guanine527-N7)-methyltransferase